MTVTYQIFVPLNLVYVRLTGKICLQEISDSLRSYVKDCDFHPSQRQIVDLTEMKDAYTAFWEMREYKRLYDALYKDFPKPLPVAIVTDSPFGKRLAWMYSRVMKDRLTLDLDVYQSIDGALQNFGVDESAFFYHLQRQADSRVLDFEAYRVAKA